MTSLMRIAPVLACVMMRHLDQASYAAVARCSRHWRAVSLLPTATPCLVRFGGCWRDVSFGALGHLRPHRLEVTPDLTDRCCRERQPSGDEHKTCDWTRVLPLLQLTDVCDAVQSLRLSLSARESAETVARFVAVLAGMTRLKSFQLHTDVPSRGVPRPPHTSTVADLISAPCASITRLAISGVSLAIGDLDLTVAALGRCVALERLMIAAHPEWKLRAHKWTQISRAVPRLPHLRVTGMGVESITGFAAAVRGAVDPQYDPVAVDGVDADFVGNDGRGEPAAMPERAFMQLESLELETGPGVPTISLVPMPNLVRLWVVGGRRPTVIAAASAASAATTPQPDATPATATVTDTSVRRTSRVAFDDREYRREMPSALPETARIINNVPSRDDPRLAYKSWTRLHQLTLDAIDLSGDELNRMPALRVLTLAARVVVCQPLVWSLTQNSQQHRRAGYLGRTVEEQQQAEKARVETTAADEPPLPYCIAAVHVDTLEVADVIRRLGIRDTARLIKMRM